MRFYFQDEDQSMVSMYFMTMLLLASSLSSVGMNEISKYMFMFILQFQCVDA